MSKVLLKFPQHRQRAVQLFINEHPGLIEARLLIRDPEVIQEQWESCSSAYTQWMNHDRNCSKLEAISNHILATEQLHLHFEEYQIFSLRVLCGEEYHYLTIKVDDEVFELLGKISQQQMLNHVNLALQLAKYQKATQEKMESLEETIKDLKTDIQAREDQLQRNVEDYVKTLSLDEKEPFQSLIQITCDLESEINRHKKTISDLVKDKEERDKKDQTEKQENIKRDNLLKLLLGDKADLFYRQCACKIETIFAECMGKVNSDDIAHLYDPNDNVDRTNWTFIYRMNVVYQANKMSRIDKKNYEDLLGKWAFPLIESKDFFKASRKLADVISNAKDDGNIISHPNLKKNKIVKEHQQYVEENLCQNEREWTDLILLLLPYLK